MSSTSSGAVDGAPDRTERVQHRTAVLLTVLVHVLLVLLVMPPPPPLTLATPQGGSGGSRMQVALIDETLSPTPPEPEPAFHKPRPRKRPKIARAIARLPTAPVSEATIRMPTEMADTSDTPTSPPTTEPEPPDPRWKTIEHPVHVSGQPPGMSAPDDNARANAALAAKLGSRRGRSNDPTPAGPDMGVDGFHVYYDLFNENRLRAWRDQGMTELFLPMPGTLRLMVCPLDVALRRGSGTCHMVDMDAPELESIGDAREVINVQRVYKLGDMVWSGPGPYR